MRKILLVLVVIFSVGMRILNAQNINIPDVNFKAYLVGNTSINTNSDSEISISEAQTFTGLINCSNDNISDLTGIEYFTSLTQLNCGGNLLTSLDLSNNTALILLGCHDNQLTNLNVKNGNNVNFTNFRADNNPNLLCIQVDDAVYSTANWTNIDAAATFNENCPALSVHGITIENASVYPNPARTIVTFSHQVNIQLTDMTGQIIICRENITTLDLSEQPNGIFFLVFIDNNGQVTQRTKIVKE